MIDVDTLVDLMDDTGDVANAIVNAERLLEQAKQNLKAHIHRFQTLLDTARFMRTMLTDVEDLLDRRSPTPEANRELALTKVQYALRNARSCEALKLLRNSFACCTH